MRNGNKIAAGAFASLAIIIFSRVCLYAADVAAYSGPSGREEKVAPGEVLVKFRSSVGGASALAYASGMGLSVVRDKNAIGVYRMKISGSRSIEEVLEELSSSPAVEYAEPNYAGSFLGTPSDAYFSQQWALDADHMNAVTAWDLDTGDPSVVIAILDTGIDLDHPDLADKVVTGRDLVNDDYDPQDDHGHGTHVAGIAAAQTDNALGVAGMNWGSRLMPVKVLDASGTGYYSDWIEGIIYAADNGAKVINLSLGGTASAQALDDAVDYAYGRGCVLCAAMGNDGNATVYYPAASLNTIAVGATDINDERANFSCYGSHIDVVAPGANILSTVLNDSYASWDGTSMATPFVSGLAALIISRNWQKGPDDIRAIIRATSEDLVGDVLEDTAGFDQYHGYGRINAYSALASVEAASPSSMSLKVGNNNINPDQGERAVVYYELSRDTDLTIKVFNTAGEEVDILFDGFQTAGRGSAEWVGRNLSGEMVASGVYYVIMNASGKIYISRIMVVR